MITTLADIDKARTTNAFAKRQTAYAGTDFSGFNNDDVIVADLMQGFTVPESLFNRPWVLDSKTVTFGMSERFSTSTGALDESVSVGSAVASLSINVPKQEYGAIIMVTVEVMPERLYPRQRDEYLHTIHQDSLPNALRDIQRTEPVDIVDCGRIDTLHTTAATAYGFEPMNAKERKERTTMGGDFRQLTPGTPNDVARTAIWQPDYVDPAFTSDHWLCPYPFPQNVFSVTDADCFDVSANQQITIVGHTQFGDELVEDNQEMADLGSNSPT